MLRRVLMLLVVVMTAGSGLLTTTAAHAGGATEWVRHYDGPLNRYGSASAVAVSPDGTTVFVTGFSEGSTASLDYSTVAYDTVTGTKKWVRRYNPGDGTDEALALAVSPDGTMLFVTGKTYREGAGDLYGTVSYATDTGATRWVRRYDGGLGENLATAIGVSPDGSTVFVTGSSNGGPSHPDYATLAYDAATGTTEWVRRYDDPAGTGYDQASALAVSPDGTTVFVTGTGGSFEYATVAYAADTGVTRWVRRYNHRDEGDEAHAVAVSPDGSTVFVTGSGAFSYLTLAYEAGTGTMVWHRRYGGKVFVKRSHANAVAVSPDSTTVFVTGASPGSTGSLDYATVAYDAATGARQWVRRHDGPANGDDAARSVAVSPNGAIVYVTGSMVVPDSGLRWFTVAYGAATGAPTWHRRYTHAGSADDQAVSVAVSPNGTRVFVTGQTANPTTGTALTTVAYAA